MVNNAAIVSIIEKLTAKKGAPCKKTLQKIVYLIENKCVDLGCDYGIHFYGPFSSDLDFAIRELHDDGVIDIEYTSMEHNISVIDSSGIGDFRSEIVDEIIGEFGSDSPSELELLATTLYVYSNTHDRVTLKEGVIKIKGSKYTPHRIEKAISRLSRTGFIPA